MEQDQGKARRHYTPDQKFKIVKEQMTTKTSVSEICKKYDISPAGFYRWQEQFLKAALNGFKKPDSGPTKAELRKIEELEKKNLRQQAIIADIAGEVIELKKKSWGIGPSVEIPRHLRSVAAADISNFQQRTDLSLEIILELFGIKKSTYYDWQKLPNVVSEKKPVLSAASVRPDEVAAVLAYRDLHPDIGYRKFTWQMVDENVAFLSESKVYDILSEHNRLQGWNRVENSGTEKEYRHKPKHVHYHWHTDIAYVKVGGVFYFLIMMLDGYSRYLLDWELMTDMLGGSVEGFVQRVKDKYPHAKPRLINDNGSQFISHDFKRLLQKLEIQQVFTRRNHPQTNGKIERLNGTVKQEALRPGQPSDFAEAWEILNKYSYEYNHQRLHAGINFLRPADMFFGRGGLVLNERREKIENARADRKSKNREEKMKTLH